MISLLEFAKSQNNLKLEFCKHLYFKGTRIGTVPAKVETELHRFSNLFEIFDDHIDILENENLTQMFEDFLLKLKSEGRFVSLKGWRNEHFRVGLDLGKPPLFSMDRGAVPLFGFFQYGVQLNGYVVNETGQISIWMQKRSDTKKCWPGRYDNIAGGGLPVGFDVFDNMAKEAFEEANIPEELVRKAIPSGSIR